jgi:hypothetical protein
MNILLDVQQQLSLKIGEIDNLKYKSNYNYLETPYANMTFPELKGIDIFKIVDPPKKNSSLETKKELEYISKLSNNRTTDEIKFVYDVDDDPMIVFEPVINKLNIDFPYRKFNTIYENIISPLIDHLKNFYNRARPFQVAEYYNININILFTKTHHTPSYPSGHTMYGALISEILSDIYPSKKGVFLDLAKKVGNARVLQGVHYQSDNDASIAIIQKIYPKIKDYPQ